MRFSVNMLKSASFASKWSVDISWIETSKNMSYALFIFLLQNFGRAMQ